MGRLEKFPEWAVLSPQASEEPSGVLRSGTDQGQACYQRHLAGHVVSGEPGDKARQNDFHCTEWCG